MEPRVISLQPKRPRESKPRLAEDVVVDEKVSVERVSVERVSVVERASEDGGERLAKEATMEPPPPPFSRLPPDGHEFPARYEEDGFRFKPEPKPRRGQAEGTKTAPEVPARPSLDEPGTFRCKVEVALEVEAFRPVPSKAEEFKTVPSKREEFRPSEEEDFRTFPSKENKLTPLPSELEEFKPVPNKEEEFRSIKAEEFVQVSSKAKYSRTLSSSKTEDSRSNKTENFVTLTSNVVEEFRPSKAESFLLVTSKTDGLRPSKAEDFMIVPSKPEESTQAPAGCKPPPTTRTENFVVLTTKVEEFRPAKTEILRPLPSKSEEFRPATTEIVSKKEDFRPRKTEESRPGKLEDFRSSKADNLRPRKTEEFRPSKTEEFRTSKTEDFRLLPSKTEDFRLLPSKPEDFRASKTDERLPERGPIRTRPVSWRSDERSDQSVRDKIAMFGRPTELSESATLPRRPPAQHPEVQEARAADSSTLPRRMPAQRVEETRAAGSSTLPRRPYAQRPEELDTRAAVTSTLPRRPHSRHELDDAVMERRDQTDNPRLHTRSHSLLDLSHRPLDELRRSSLAALVEQRRRGMSKLRGLVIPERSEPAPPAPGALDLPEIHSREEAALEPWPRGRASSVTASIPGYASLPGYATLPSLPLPKTSPPLPKTLPPTTTTQNSAPFLRSKDTFVLSLKQESSPSPNSLPPIPKPHESWMSAPKPNVETMVFPKTNGLPAIPPKLNGLPAAAPKPTGSATVALKSNGLAPVMVKPKGPSTVTLKSSVSAATVKSPETSPPPTYVSFLRPQTSFVTTLRPVEAVPRTTSAVETKVTEMPPPLPPSLPPSLPPVRDDLDGLPRESGHASASRTSSVDSSGGRILAPRSLEAMNRKSVLSSARHSSGRDLKVGSPQIQRKFSDSEDSDDVDHDSDDDEDNEDDDEDEGDFCDEGAVECDDLVFFPGRAKTELPSHAKAEFLSRHKTGLEDLVQAPIRVAYVTHVTDPEMPFVTNPEYVTVPSPEMVHVNDGGRRRLLVSGQPRAEPKLVTRDRAPKATLNEALNELIAPREPVSKTAKEQMSVDENQNDFKKKSSKVDVIKALVDQNCKEQALKAANDQISKEKALKASLDKISKEKALKASLDKISKEKALKALLDQTAKEQALQASFDQIAKEQAKEQALKALFDKTTADQASKASIVQTSKDQAAKAPKNKPPKASTDQIPNGHSSSVPKEQSPKASKSRTSKDRVAASQPSKSPREPPPKEQVGTTSRDRRCVSVSEIHVAFQKAERMTHARSVSLDADACASNGTSARTTELEIVLRRSTPMAGLGLALAGGADLEAKRVTVHKVLQGGAAARDGRLRRGDHVVRINGAATRGLTHAQSVAALKEPRLEVTLIVSRPESEAELSGVEASAVETSAVEASAASGGEVTVTLVKEAAGLGFSLDGGRDSPLGDVPLTVKKLFLGGVAERSGLVHEGDRVLRIGARDVTQMSRLEAWAAMKRLPEGPVVLSLGPARP